MKTSPTLAALVVGSLLWVQPTSARRADGSSESWRASWPEFARTLDAFAKSSRDIPRASLAHARTGLPAPRTLEVMKRFGGPVTFEGVLKGITTRNLLDGRFAKLKVDLARPTWGWRVHLYPKAESFKAWTAVPAGTPVAFRAVVAGIARMPPDGVFWDNGYTVLLEDAELVPTPAQDFSIARARWTAGNVGSYEYTFRLSCFCPPALLKPMTFRVSQGRATEITATDDATRRLFERYDTIDKLFALVERAIEEGPRDLEARYDAALGYPQAITIARSQAIVDEQVSFAVTGFKVVK
jgi:hypothetical protein